MAKTTATLANPVVALWESLKRQVAGAALAFFLSVKPVPAARPRVTTKGWSYYPKTYQAYMKSAQEALKEWPHPQTDKPVLLYVDQVVEKPKTSKLAFPKGDVDNYLKAPMDALTKAGAWGDDNQVVAVLAVKRFADKGEASGTHIEIIELEA